jgi:uncharacterized protein YlzI (FlbEa/FlbD family)
MKKFKEVEGQEFLINPKLVEMAWLKKVKEGEAPVTIIVTSSGKQMAVEGDQLKELE